MTPLSFYNYHRQNYADKLPPRPPEFMVGGYGEDGLDERGEFRIELHDFQHGKPLSPEIGAFHDAYPALLEAIGVGLLGAIQRTEIHSPDDLSRLLLSLGLRDMSDRPLETAS